MMRADIFAMPMPQRRHALRAMMLTMLQPYAMLRHAAYAHNISRHFRFFRDTRGVIICSIDAILMFDELPRAKRLMARAIRRVATAMRCHERGAGRRRRASDARGAMVKGDIRRALHTVTLLRRCYAHKTTEI